MQLKEKKNLFNLSRNKRNYFAGIKVLLSCGIKDDIQLDSFSF